MARFSEIAHLKQHRLSFRKNDAGQSGKYDVKFTGNSADIVIGVIYKISDDDH
jgi:hypothetical protein